MLVAGLFRNSLVYSSFYDGFEPIYDKTYPGSIWCLNKNLIKSALSQTAVLQVIMSPTELKMQPTIHLQG
jgi:hypothetical protein